MLAKAALIRPVSCFLCLMFIFSCSSDKITPDYNGFPKEAGQIIINKCATPGCHNAQSKDAAEGLNLESWNTLFEGSENGPVAIPYRSDFSSLIFFTNTYADMGISLAPSMPLNQSPLTREEVTILKDWIDRGAPDNTGFIKFSGNPYRKKFYVTNQGCDVVTVVDEETGIPMRYIDVGNNPGIESPHLVKVSPDGQYWYVIFSRGDVIQKYRTSDDSYVGEIYIGLENWNTFVISSDSQKAFCVDWSDDGQVFYLDLANLVILKKYSGVGLFIKPHGVAINSASTTLYVTGQTGNFIYKIDISDPLSPGIDQITLDGGPVNTAPSLDPHEIALSPDGTKYYVTCQGSNEVKVFNTSDDAPVAAISTGTFPQEPVFSSSAGYLFVSCPEDTLAFPGKRGCVSVIDYQSNTFVKNIFTGFQPHGMAVDDDKKQVLVANRNATPKGPAPHHSSGCGGRNGYITFIDMNTLDVSPDERTEISVDPYSVAYRK